MPPPPPRNSFASDNSAGFDPVALAALVAANDGPAVAYGADRWTAAARHRFHELFGAPVDVAFCWGGTGANIVGLQLLLRPYEAVICAAGSHIATDEGGAPERFLGAKLLDLHTPDGKLRPEQVLEFAHYRGDVHHVQPRVVSITQSTEVGTVYQADEIATLADIAHANKMFLHLDGARLGNAVAATAKDHHGNAIAATAEDVRAHTIAAGVDVCSFGGAKSGLGYGEAVVVFRPELAEALPYLHKHAAQLPSKLRFVGAQFDAILADGRWLANAAHANAMARVLAEAVADIPGVTVTRTPEANAVFATIPQAALAPLQAWSFFWEWEPAISEVRWMTSWATTADDVATFAAGLRQILATLTA